jgi:heptosyltransferase II
LKVLIVKIGAIGDVIMALPMLDALFENDPQSEVTWLCGKAVEPLLKKFERIKELVVVDEEKLLKGSLFQRLGELTKIWLKLLGRRFELVVTGNPDWRYRLLSATVIAKTRRSFDRKGKRPWPIPGRFFSAEYVRLVTDVDSGESPSFKIPEVNWPLSPTLEQKIGKDKNRKTVAIAPGGARNVLRDNALRRWPVDSYKDLAGLFLNKGYKVLLVGAPSDEWILPSFEGMDVVNLVGQTDLVDLVALLGACNLVVTHDSGPMHAAVLAGTPLVALFGPTDPRWFTVSTRKATQVLWGGEDLPCRPCYDGRNFAPCTDNQCLKGIRVEQVYDAALEMLQKQF